MGKVNIRKRRSKSFGPKVREIIKEINSIVRIFESNYISSKIHHLDDHRERILTIDQLIKCRLVFELSKIPEFEEELLYRSGEDFFLVEVIGFDEKSRRFEEVRITFTEDEGTLLGDLIYDLFCCKSFSFSDSPKVPRLTKLIMLED